MRKARESESESTSYKASYCQQQKPARSLKKRSGTFHLFHCNVVLWGEPGSGEGLQVCAARTHLLQVEAARLQCEHLDLGGKAGNAYTKHKTQNTKHNHRHRQTQTQTQTRARPTRNRCEVSTAQHTRLGTGARFLAHSTPRRGCNSIPDCLACVCVKSSTH